MVERLKAAIEKARETRGAAAGSLPAAGLPPADDLGALWAALPEAEIDVERLARERLVSYDRRGPAHVAFDVLRTRLLNACAPRGWTRIGITSPTKGCGKSVVACNLALSIARQPEMRVILADLDLRAPALASRFGARGAWRIADLLEGRTPPSAHLQRVGERLAIAFNARVESHSAELVQSAAAAATLGAMRDAYRPGLTIYDLPPILVSDDTIGFLPNADAVVLIAAAGRTTAAEIEESARLIGEGAAFIGVVLNKCEDDAPEAYHYEAGG